MSSTSPRPQTTEVRLAYLISAYRDPKHLARLVEALNYHADFYVHVDANVDITPFRAALPPSVHFVPRHAVTWGGWNQVKYQMELMQSALQSGQIYSHLVCLSGQDYPLWSNSRIHRFFQENATRECICGYNLTQCSEPAPRRKVTLYHLFRDWPLHHPWLRNKLIVASRNLLRYIGVRRHPQVTISGQPCDVYFGSDYWALTPPCARYVCNQLLHEPQIARFFRTTFVPSELCLQTLVFHSPYAKQALLHEGSYPGLTALTPLHFIDYGACIKELTLDDLPRLQAADKMFCRKVLSGKSDALVSHIDALRRADDITSSMP